MNGFFNRWLTRAALVAAMMGATGAQAVDPYQGGNFTGTPLVQDGSITSGNCASWKANGRVQDAGAACGSGGGGSVSVTAATPDIVVTPSPGTGTFTVGSTAALRTQTNTTDTITSTDAAKFVLESNASAIAAALNTPSAQGYGVQVATIGAGATTITPAAGTILGGSTLFLPSATEVALQYDGSNFWGILGVPPYPNDSTKVLKGNGTWGTVSASCSGDINAGCSQVTGLNGSTFAAFFASPSPIGGTVAAAGTFTALGANTFTLSGNASINPLGTAGVGIVVTGATYTDNEATGTVAVGAIHAIGRPTLTAPNTVTYTRAGTLVINNCPNAGTGATITNCRALYIQNGGMEVGGTVQLNSGINANGGAIALNAASSTNTTNIGTSSTTGTVAIGGGSNTVTINGGTSLQLTNLTTGTNADFLCLSAGNQVLVQTSACTISSRRFKDDIEEYADQDGLGAIMAYQPVTFRLKDGATNPDTNAARTQIGLTAENVAGVDRRAAIYEPDGATPKSYRQESIIAQLVAAVQAQQREITSLHSEHCGALGWLIGCR